MYISIDELVEDILGNPLPLVFIDTCSMLDIVNSLHQAPSQNNYISDMKILLNNCPQNVRYITCQTIFEEWNDNIEMVVATAEKEIRYFDIKCIKTSEAANSLTGLMHTIDSLSEYKLPILAKDVSLSFLNACQVLKREDNHILSADHRVRKNLAPAKKGKSEPKDCEIIECFLDLSKNLRERNFNKKIVFQTSNIHDFGKPNKLLTPLDEEFEEVNAEISNHPNHVISIVGLN